MKPALMTNCQNLVVLRSYPANFMKISPLFMEIWPFESIHFLNFNMQRQNSYELLMASKLTS